MSKFLNLSRAAKLIGVPRAILQQYVKEGRLESFDGMISTESLLAAFPESKFEEDPVFERITRIKEESFGKRIRERILPDREVLSARLYEQSRELADYRRHLERYHAIVVEAQEKLRVISSARPEVADLAKWLDHELGEALVTEAPDALDAMENYLRIVSAHVRIEPSGREYFVDGADTLLEAALRAGIAFNYGCSGGNCGLCKARLVSGETRQVRHQDYILSEAEKRSGFILACCHTAVNDIVIEALEAGQPEDIPVQEIEVKVKSVEQVGAISRITLQTPRSSRLRFLAGQSVYLFDQEYPIASCPCDDRNLEFHVLPNDVLSRLQKGETVLLQGPYGKFVLNERSGREPLFIASETGFAPIKSLIEHAMALDIYSAIMLIRTSHDGYLSNLCRAWESALDNFDYVETEEIQAALPDLAARDVYLAGPAAFVEEMKKSLMAKGLPASQLFTPSGA